MRGGVINKFFNCGPEVTELELQSRSYIYFQTKYPYKSTGQISTPTNSVTFKENRKLKKKLK